jgi:hypothetical protein
VSHFDEGSLASETTRCLRQLGDLEQARQQAERIISLRPSHRPETTGNNRDEPGNPDMRTGRQTRESGGPFHARRFREAAGQNPQITP